MTVTQSIAKASASLPPEKQREVLAFVEFLKARAPVAKKPRPRVAATGKHRTLHPAVRAIAGIWKDRTDLAEDPIKAVKELRTRMGARGRNA